MFKNDESKIHGAVGDAKISGKYFKGTKVLNPTVFKLALKKCNVCEITMRNKCLTDI